MAKIVGVHGIAQQLKGPSILATEWLPAMRDGVFAARGKLDGEPLCCAFYGGLFRVEGHVRDSGNPAYRAADVAADEADLLAAWWQNGAVIEPDRVVAPEAAVRSTPNVIQAGLRALARSRFFAGITEQVLIGDLKQVRRYLREPDIRSAARESVNAVVTDETQLIVAHSLGSVVAYEALHRYSDSPNWKNVTTLVTLGSPLGIPNLIFDSLEPAPVKGKGLRPPRIKRWVNISDDGDVVALQKKLGLIFDGELVDISIDNEATAHDIRPYLTDRKTGETILDALR